MEFEESPGVENGGLTVTKVVFEYLGGSLPVKMRFRLTVTKVVFEYMLYLLSYLMGKGLTVTKVVFEFGLIIAFFTIVTMINSNKGCF